MKDRHLLPTDLWAAGWWFDSLRPLQPLRGSRRPIYRFIGDRGWRISPSSIPYIFLFPQFHRDDACQQRDIL
jgi:hypothetical protein